MKVENGDIYQESQQDKGGHCHPETELPRKTSMAMQKMWSTRGGIPSQWRYRKEWRDRRDICAFRNETRYGHCEISRAFLGVCMRMSNLTRLLCLMTIDCAPLLEYSLPKNFGLGMS